MIYYERTVKKMVAPAATEVFANAVNITPLQDLSIWIFAEAGANYNFDIQYMKESQTSGVGTDVQIYDDPDRLFPVFEVNPYDKNFTGADAIYQYAFTVAAEMITFVAPVPNTQTLAHPSVFDVRVSSLAGGGIIYKEGRDYTINTVNGRITQLNTAHIPLAGTVFVDYSYRDTVLVANVVRQQMIALTGAALEANSPITVEITNNDAADRWFSVQFVSASVKH